MSNADSKYYRYDLNCLRKNEYLPTGPLGDLHTAAAFTGINVDLPVREGANRCSLEILKENKENNIKLRSQILKGGLV